MKARKRRRGDGTVVKLPSGKYQAKISGGIDPTTKRRLRVNKTFETENDARKWLRKQGAERDRGELPFTVASGKVGDWLNEWLAETEATTSPRTHAEYKQCVEKHVLPFLKDVAMKSLTADVVASWRDKLLKADRSPSRVRRAMAYLSIAMNAAVHRGRLPKNPVEKMKRPKHVAKEVEVLTRQQVGTVLSHLRGRRHEPLVRFWLDTGCRTGEVFALRWTDLDLDGPRVHIRRTVEEVSHTFREKEPKSAAGRRTLPITLQTAAALRLHRDGMRERGLDVEAGLVFPGLHAGHVSRSNWSRSWRLILTGAGIPKKKPYVLRHTCASLLLSSGVSLKAVQKRLGHEDPMLTLKTYAHLMPEDEVQTIRALSDLFGGP